MGRMVANAFIIFCYACLILGYAYAEFKSLNRSKHGSILAVTIVVCDVYLWMIYKSKMIKSPATLSLFAAITRYLAFMTGKDMWIYGYFAIYILLSSFLATKISQRHLPFHVQHKREDLIDLKNPKNTNIGKVIFYPEAILILITACMLISMTILSITKPNGVPLRDLPFLNNHTLHYYSVAFYSCAIVFTYWCTYSLYRSARRRIMKLQESEFWIKQFHFRFYQVAFVNIYVVCLCWSGFWWWVYESAVIRDCLIFLPAIFLTFLHSAVGYIQNDFRIFQEVFMLNRAI
jgi:hypothetical protein